ncbi:MAG: acyl-CoA dehydrogenase [Gemmatimonadetes bacterium]|nr:acyl-CoA dehydrogenase [Gemmatimonadota bacterium]
MPFFTADQLDALRLIRGSDEVFDELSTFLSGPLNDLIGARIASRAARNDRDELFDTEAFAELGALGFMALAYPEELGGMAACFSYYNAGLESLAKADAGLALAVAIHGTATDGIARFASKELRERYVPDLITGHKIGAFALSEANAGSDAQALACRYRRDPDTGEYVLNGTKYWITNGLSADLFFVMARGPEGRISAFVVAKGNEGSFTQAKIQDKMGVRGSNTAELVFEDYRVPADHIVGEEGHGFRYAMHMLNGGRVTIAAWATGIAQGAYEKLLQYSAEREMFGGRLFDLDNTKKELSEMSIEIDASRLLAYRAGLYKGEDRDIRKSAAVAKVKASETAVYVSERAIELAGGYGYVTDSRIERHLRDALLARIGEGANEVLKIMVIPRVLEKELSLSAPTEPW